MKKPQFSNGEIYHIYNRGVEKRKIFMDKQDYLRFIHCLFIFNDENATLNNMRYFNPKSGKVELISIKQEGEPRELLVDILIFTLMPNHFHLLLRQRVDNGIVKFMQKLGTGCAMYFNKKYERVGGLFQGRFKAKLVEEHAHLVHLPFYIHTNPMDLSTDQDERGSTSFKGTEKLKEYRWSSFPDYVGIKNFPSVTNRDFYLEFFGGEKQYLEETKKWLKEREENTELIGDVKLD